VYALIIKNLVMDTNIQTQLNIRQAVPFFMVTDIERSLKFYVGGLGFEMKNKWTPHNKIEWCCLQREGAAIMLQEYKTELAKKIQGRLGKGVCICFICDDALKLYKEFISKSLSPAEPFVGNGMWDVAINDPDGYILRFESLTDVPEETMYSQWQKK